MLKFRRIPARVCITLILALALLATAATGLRAAVVGSNTTPIPRPEHPRPDQFRANWITLNGPWQFEIDDKGDGEARGLMSGKNLASTILVPFPPESKLSGLAHYDLMKNVWYRRAFEVPAAMREAMRDGGRVLLHFGGIDYKATVWINGNLAGGHTGGNVSFSLDITRLLRADGAANEIVVRALDDTASGNQPTGKQTHNTSQGCLYTRTTGIWQPVWLEAVGSSFVENFSIVPDPDHSRVLIEATINGNDRDLTLTAEAFADGKKVGEESCPADAWRNNRLVLNLSEKKLWAPGAPFLYDLKLTLSRDTSNAPLSHNSHISHSSHPSDAAPTTQKLDELTSYFGLRKVTIEGRAILINGKRIFQRLILDQGFYPDGIWTAPSDAELRADIERSLAAGYNGARLHQKVFEPRYLYWADKLGYLVWGEFPNWGFNYKPENYANYINEWTEVLQRDRNHPAIIGWCPFNESRREAGELQAIIWHETKAIDPTRPLLETSGWYHLVPTPEVRDDHDYNKSADVFRQRWTDFFSGRAPLIPPLRYASKSAPPRADLGVPFMVSEFGGIGWDARNEQGRANGPKTHDEFYAEYAGLVDALLDNPNMFGFCYTQLTDVEQEHNGLYYYDRRPKFDLSRIRAITARPAAFETTGPTVPPPPPAPRESDWQVLVGAAPDGVLSKPWRYAITGVPPAATQAKTHHATTATAPIPPAANWNQPDFDDSAWPTGLAPFGRGAPGIRTAWKTSDIWLRQEFDYNTGASAAPGASAASAASATTATTAAAAPAPLKTAALVIFYDEDTEVYVNGKLIWKHGGFTTTYDMFDITAALNAALKPGRNTLAVHTHQTAGGQIIDLALLCEPEGNQALGGVGK